MQTLIDEAITDEVVAVIIGAANVLFSIHAADGCPPGHADYLSKKDMSRMAGKFESILVDLIPEKRRYTKGSAIEFLKTNTPSA